MIFVVECGLSIFYDAVKRVNEGMRPEVEGRRRSE